MDEPNNLPNPVPDGANVPPAGGIGNAEDVVGLKDLTKDLTGRDYPSDVAAASAIQETYNAVGWAPQYKPVIDQLRTRLGSDYAVLDFLQKGTSPQTAPAVDPAQYVPREQYETDTFFNQNPQYTPYRELIDALRAKSGKALSEVVQTDAFKGTFDDAEAHRQTEKSKSVVHSSPRLGQATDKMTEAKQEVKTDYVRAADKATTAVIDAFDLTAPQR